MDFWVYKVNARIFSAVRSCFSHMYSVIPGNNFFHSAALVGSVEPQDQVLRKPGVKFLGGNTLHTEARIRHISLYAYTEPYSSPVQSSVVI